MCDKRFNNKKSSKLSAAQTKLKHNLANVYSRNWAMQKHVNNPTPSCLGTPFLENNDVQV